MKSAQEFAEQLNERLRIARKGREERRSMRTDIEIICLEITARDAEHVAAIRELAPARQFGEWPDRPQGVPWPAAYGKFTSPPWVDERKLWADRVTETSVAAIEECQRLQRERYTCPVCDGGPGNNCACSCPKG